MNTKNIALQIALSILLLGCSIHDPEQDNTKRSSDSISSSSNQLDTIICVICKDDCDEMDSLRNQYIGESVYRTNTDLSNCGSTDPVDNDSAVIDLENKTASYYSSVDICGDVMMRAEVECLRSGKYVDFEIKIYRGHNWIGGTSSP